MQKGKFKRSSNTREIKPANNQRSKQTNKQAPTRPNNENKPMLTKHRYLSNHFMTGGDQPPYQLPTDPLPEPARTHTPVEKKRCGDRHDCAKMITWPWHCRSILAEPEPQMQRTTACNTILRAWKGGVGGGRGVTVSQDLQMTQGSYRHTVD